MQKGFTILEVLIVLAIIAILVAIIIPELHNARARAHAGAIIADSRSIYNAFKRYQVDNSAYYSTFALDTFEPLRSSGEYNGIMARLLFNGQADGFDSPDDMGADQEFWIEMTVGFEPSIRILVADSDDAPLSGGVWLDGVYRFQNGVLVPL